MKSFFTNNKKQIVLVSVLLVFVVILVVVIINRDKINFDSLMGNSTTSTAYRIEYYCDEGWVYRSNTKTCERLVGEMVEANVEYYCPEGYEKSGNQCIKTTQMLTNEKCPEGTEFIGSCAGCPSYCQKVEKKMPRQEK